MSSIAVHSSTVAPVSAAAATSKASTAFSPPAGSVLFAVIGGTGSAAAATGVSDSLGAHLTWTKLVAETANSCDSEIWYAPCPSSQAGMTVTVTFAGAQDISIGVIVLTGAASSQAGTGTGIATSASGTPSVSVTTTASGSQVIASIANFTNQTAPTIANGESNVINSLTFRTTLATHVNSWWAQMLTAIAGKSGNVVAMSDTAPAAVAYSAAAVEVLAASANTLNAESASFNSYLAGAVPRATCNALINPVRGGAMSVGQAVQASTVR